MTGVIHDFKVRLTHGDETTVVFSQLMTRYPFRFRQAADAVLRDWLYTNPTITDTDFGPPARCDVIGHHKCGWIDRTGSLVKAVYPLLGIRIDATQMIHLRAVVTAESATEES